MGEAAGLRVRDCDLLRRRVTIARIPRSWSPGDHWHTEVPQAPHGSGARVRRRTPCIARQGREDLLFPGPAGFMRPPRGTGGWFANVVARASAPTVQSYMPAEGEQGATWSVTGHRNNGRLRSRSAAFRQTRRQSSSPRQSRFRSYPDSHPHDLRHTAASLAVSAGANVKAVQKMLGHASAAMTLDIYANLIDDYLDAVVSP